MCGSRVQLGGTTTRPHRLAGPRHPVQMLAMLAPDSPAAASAEYLEGAAKTKWKHNATAADPLFNQARWAWEGRVEG